MAEKIKFREEDRQRWSAFWRTAGGVEGCRKIAEELGVDGPGFVDDIRRFLFASPDHEKASRLLEGLREVRETIRRGVYEGDRSGIGGFSVHAEHSAR